MLEGPIRQFRILESRLNLIDRRTRDAELRLGAIEDGIWEAQSTLSGQAPAYPTALFQVNATGCSSLALTSEPCIARFMWGDVYNSATSTDYGDQPANTALDLACTSDPSTGLVAFNFPWPYAPDALGQKVPLDTLEYVVWNSTVGAYVFDPTSTSPIQAWANVQVYTVEQTKYSGHGWHGAATSSTPSVITSCMVPVPTSNSWTLLPLAAYRCWTGSGSARPISAHTLNVTGGTGGTFSNFYAAFTVANGSVLIWLWTGSAWHSAAGAYDLFWSFNQPTEQLTLTVYTVNPGGGSRLVAVGSEFVGTPSPSPTTVTLSAASVTPASPGPFSCNFDFSSTAIQTLTGITTCTITAP